MSKKSYKPSFITLLFIFINSFLYSQISDFGRFEINNIGGCSPIFVEIINENVDSSVTVIQYDFNYSLTTNIFNPSNSKSHTYLEAGTYIIAQAINQDGVEKIDLLEIEIKESKNIDIQLYNCENNKMNISINDNYYQEYELYINDILIQTLLSGKNDFDYSSFIGTNNKINGYIVGLFNNKNDNCNKFNFEIASIQNPHEEIIDSIILSDDKANFDLYYTPNKSTNYNIYIDNVIDSTFLSPSYIYFSESKINFNNLTFDKQCVQVIEEYYCNSKVIEDEICLIYLSSYENNEGINLDLKSIGNFDSTIIYKNNTALKTFPNINNKYIDNQGIIMNEEICYTIKGYDEKKISISNTVCETPANNYNPIPIPNAFTPNDDGLNDTFKPYESNIEDYTMLIFNKFGEKIFTSNDINIGWDGYFKGKIRQGSYVYKIVFKIDGKEITQTGKFVLIK